MKRILLFVIMTLVFSSFINADNTLILDNFDNSNLNSLIWNVVGGSVSENTANASVTGASSFDDGFRSNGYYNFSSNGQMVLKMNITSTHATWGTTASWGPMFGMSQGSDGNGAWNSVACSNSNNGRCRLYGQGSGVFSEFYVPSPHDFVCFKLVHGNNWSQWGYCNGTMLTNQTISNFDFRVHVFGYDPSAGITKINYLEFCEDTDLNSDCNPISPTYFEVSLINNYTDVSINNFSVEINNTLYNTTNGTIVTNLYKNSTSLYNITYINNEAVFFNKTFFNINISNNHQGNVFQNIIGLNCLDEQDNIITCLNNTLYPNSGVYNLSINATGYYVVTEENTFTSLQNETIDIEGFYSNKYGFLDSITNAKISGLDCNVDDTTYTFDSNNDINISWQAYTTRNLTCELKGQYSEHSWFLTEGLNYTNLTISPYALRLYFSSVTNGTITDTNQTISFNNTQVVYKQTQFEIGKVTIRWAEPNNTQVMEYYNDRLNTIEADLKVVGGNLLSITKTIRVLGEGVILSSARVTAEEYNGTDWLVVYGRLTDSDGQAELLLENNKDYRITAQATGYTAKFSVVSTSSTDTSIEVIDLDKSSNAKSGEILTNCINSITEARLCYYNVICDDICSIVSISYTIYKNDSTTTTGSASKVTTTGNTFEINIPSNTDNWTVNTFEDGTQTSSINNTLVSYNDRSKSPIFIESIINSTENSSKIWIVIIFLLGIVIAGFAESKVMRNSGILVAGGWYIIWGTIIPVLMVMGIIISLFKISLTIMKKVNEY